MMHDTILQGFRGLRYEVRTVLAREAVLWVPYQIIVKWGQYKIRRAGDIDVRERVIGPHTELVIDGMQGSANTFLTRAFKFSQPTPVMLAHHLHSPSQIRQAVRLGLPTIVTIREPRGAVLSLTSRWPYVSVAQGLRTFIHFYEGLRPHAEGFIISPFEWTTRRPDRVIAEVNRTFGVGFALFEPTPENVEAVRQSSEQREADARRRRAIKEKQARAFETEKCRRLLERAEALHEEYLQLSRRTLHDG